MKLVGAVFTLCLLLCFPSFAQTVESEIKAEISVEEITLFKDDGAGAMGDEAEVFEATDVPIHCSILLSSIESAAVKMEVVAVKAAGIKSGAKIVTVNYKTGGKHDRVNFTAAPAASWAAGAYRVDIFINGKLSGSKGFEITKSSAK